MADLTKGLLNLNLSPEQAMLLDRQAREQQIQQQTQATPDVFRGMLQQAMRTADTLQNVPRALMGEAPRRGVYEQAAIKAEQERGTRKGNEIKEISELVKRKTATGEISKEEGLSVVRMVAQDLMSFEDALNKFSVADSGEWRALGDGNTIYNTKTGDEKQVGDTTGFERLTSKDVLRYAGQYTPESLEAWQSSISSENPSGDVSLLKSLVKESRDASIAASDKKAYNVRQQQMGVHNSRAGKLEGLASNLELNAEDMSSGAKATIEGMAKELFGTQDYESVLRTQVEEMRAQVAISNLPPGVASDADVALVLRGTLPATADPRTQARFLRGIAKIEKTKADSIQDMQLYIDNPNNKDKSLIGYETYRLKKMANETLDYIAFNSDKIPKEAVDEAITVIDRGNSYEIEMYKQSFIKHFGVDFVTAYINMQRN